MSGRAILVVDDSSDIQNIFSTIGELENCTIWPASNGAEALEMLGANREKPCAIFLDLTMPVMNGRDFLIELRRRFRDLDVPVVLMTAINESVDDLPVEHRLSKPFSYGQLKEVLRTIV